MSQLTAENATEFWSAAWANNRTGWRSGEEHHYFTRNTFIYFAALDKSGSQVTSLPLTVDARTPDDEAYNTEKELQSVRRCLRGKTVLVPLCGDTKAISYFARDAGAACVVGAELSEQAMQAQMAVNFADVLFNKLVLAEGDEGGVPTLYEATVGDCHVQLYRGDFLKLPQYDAYKALSVDFVYDRASFMAMSPALRPSYVRAVVASLASDAGVMLECPVRAEGDTSGPPYTFSIDDVVDLYNQCGSHKFTSRLLVKDSWRSGNAMSSVKGIRWFGVYSSA